MTDIRADYDSPWKEALERFFPFFLELFRIIDWLMTLPAEQALEFDRMVEQLEEDRKLTYVTSFERHGIERGMRQGLQQGLQDALVVALRAKFGECPARIAEQIAVIDDPDRLTQLLSQAVTGGSLAEFERLLPPTLA